MARYEPSARRRIGRRTVLLLTRASRWAPRWTDRADQLVAEEAAVPDQQHARPEVVEQRADHRRLAVAERLDRQAADGVRAQLAEGQEPDLGEGPLGAAGRRAGRRCGRWPGCRAGRAWCRRGPSAASRGRRRPTVWWVAMGRAVSRNSCRSGATPSRRRAWVKAESVGLGLVAAGVEPAPDLGDRVGGEQGHGDDQPDDRLGRQAAAPFRGAAGPC